MYIYARRGSESKYCLDSTRHNSMFISIIFLTWFRLFARTFARSLGVIILCTSAACFWEYRWIFSFSLAFNVASVEFLLQKKTKWKKRMEKKIPKSFYVTFIDFKCKTSNLSLCKFEHKPLIFSFFTIYLSIYQCSTFV